MTRILLCSLLESFVPHSQALRACIHAVSHGRPAEEKNGSAFTSGTFSGKSWMDVRITSSLARAKQELGKTAISRPDIRCMERKD